MPLAKDTSTSRVLREVANHIDEYGEQHTLSVILKDKKDNAKKSVHSHIDKIIQIICAHFSMPVDKIYTKGKHDIKKKQALRFICYYCCEKLIKFGITQKSISIKLKRAQPLISVHHSEMIQKKKDFSDGNKTCQKHFKELDSLITEYIKSLKQKAENKPTTTTQK